MDNAETDVKLTINLESDDNRKRRGSYSSLLVTTQYLIPFLGVNLFVRMDRDYCFPDASAVNCGQVKV